MKERARRRRDIDYNKEARTRGRSPALPPGSALPAPLLAQLVLLSVLQRRPAFTCHSEASRRVCMSRKSTCRRTLKRPVTFPVTRICNACGTRMRKKAFQACVRRWRLRTRRRRASTTRARSSRRRARSRACSARPRWRSWRAASAARRAGPLPARTARCTMQSLLRGVQCAILRAAMRMRLAQAVTGGPVRAWAVEAAGLCWLLCALQAGVMDKNSC